MKPRTELKRHQSHVIETVKGNMEGFTEWQVRYAKLARKLAMSFIVHRRPSTSINVHHRPSVSITVHHCPSSSIVTHHCPLSSIVIHHHPSSTILVHHFPLLYVIFHQWCSALQLDAALHLKVATRDLVMQH